MHNSAFNSKVINYATWARLIKLYDKITLNNGLVSLSSLTSIGLPVISELMQTNSSLTGKGTIIAVTVKDSDAAASYMELMSYLPADCVPATVAEARYVVTVTLETETFGQKYTDGQWAYRYKAEIKMIDRTTGNIVGNNTETITGSSPPSTIMAGQSHIGPLPMGSIADTVAAWLI